MVCSRCPRQSKNYDTILKRKCFRKFRNNVWESKTKWKLLDKADYYCRWKLLRKCFNSWTDFASESVKEKVDTKLAYNHYEEKIKRKVVLALRKHAEKNQAFANICKQKVEWNLKVRAWHQWRPYTLKRLKIREIKILADKIREERLIVRFFYLWTFRFKEKCFLQETLARAKYVRETRLKRKVLSSWVSYKNRSVYKKEILRLSIVCWEGKLKEKVFQLWRKYNLKKRMYRNQIQIIQKFYVNYLLKNYLSHWHSVHEKLVKERELFQKNLATHFYTKKLLGKCFKGVKEFAEGARLRTAKSIEFYERYRHVYVSFYISVWVSRRCERIHVRYLEKLAWKWREEYLMETMLMKLINIYEERIQEKEQLTNADKYHKAIILYKTFKAWEKVTERKIHQQMQLEHASEWYLTKQKRRAMETWKTFMLLKYQKKTAITYCENRMLQKAMSQWKLLREERKLKVAAAIVLEKKHSKRLLIKVLEEWRSEVTFGKTKMGDAATYYKKSKLVKSFNVWKKHVDTQRERKRQYNHNKTIINTIIVKSFISCWCEMRATKLYLKEKVDAVKQNQNHRLAKLSLIIWRKFTRKTKNIRQAEKLFPQIKEMMLLEHCTDRLLEVIASWKVLKKNEEQARIAEEKFLKRKCFKRWVAFICWKKSKMCQCVVDGTCKGGIAFTIPLEKGFRRQPMIPHFLKADIHINEYGDAPSLSQSKTFRVAQPINKRIPIVGQNGKFVSFET